MPFGASKLLYIVLRNTYAAMIGIIDDQGNKVFTGFRNSLKNITDGGGVGLLIETIDHYFGDSDDRCISKPLY